MHLEKFSPPLWLRSSHTQTIFSSSGPRAVWIDFFCKPLIRTETQEILDTPSGGNLLCYKNIPANASKALVLIHGWEGSSHSGYILSAAQLVYQQDIAVFRINLRDHGDSHHLNEELFRSTRLNEVSEALTLLEAQHPNLAFTIAGYSLGGNFVLRIASQASQTRQYVAICPVIKPEKTLAILEQQQFLYHRYFVKKWKRSLRKKLLHFPDINGSKKLLEANSLAAMHITFVEHHSEENSPAEYFANYEIRQTQIDNIQHPTHIISSLDDPIIPAEDFKKLSSNKYVNIDLQTYGGHCGFIDQLFGASWIDRYLVHLVSSQGNHYD